MAGILNPIEQLIRDFANETLDRYGSQNVTEQQISFLWGFVNTSYTLGYCIGPIVQGYCSDKFGRRVTVMVVTSVLIILSSVLGAVAKLCNLFELLVLSRLVASIAEPISLFCYVYIMECCATEDAKLSGTIVRIGDCAWYVLGAVTGLPQCLGTDDTWHYIVLIPLVPALLYIALAPFVPESPKHLLISLNQEDKCRKAIQFYYGPNVFVDAIIDQYRLEALQANQSTVGLWSVMSVRHLRWPFIISVIATVSTRTSGFDIDLFYSTQLIADMGVSPEQSALYNLLFLRVPIVLLAILFVPLSQHCSTSRSLVITVLVCSLSVSALCISEAIDDFWPDSNVAVMLLISAIATQMCAFHLGAFFPKILPGQICPQAIRSLTSAYASGITGVTSVIITFSFPALSTLMGESLALLPLVVVSWVVSLWLWKYLPETRNRTINQILTLWIPQNQQEELVELV